MHRPPRSLFLRQCLTRASLLAFLWWVLTGGEPHSWQLGIPMVVASLAASFLLPDPPAWRWRPAGVLRFLPFFLWNSLLAGLDVARRALQPQLPLNPGLIDYRWLQPPGPGRVFLANTISLLPGTLSAEFDHRKLTIHALDVNLPVWSSIQRLESLVAGMFYDEQSSQVEE